LYIWWGLKEGDLSNGLGDCLPKWDVSFGEGEIGNRWSQRALRQYLREELCDVEK
jgi:hypothetical protein